MSGATLWWMVLAICVVTAAIKAAGPVVLGGRPLPARLGLVVVLLPPALLAALVVTSALAEGRQLGVDAATVGVAVGGLLLWWRRPMLVAVLAAAAVTALLRFAL